MDSSGSSVPLDWRIDSTWGARFTISSVMVPVWIVVIPLFSLSSANLGLMAVSVVSS